MTPTASPQSTQEPISATRIPRPSWLAASVAVLTATGRPMCAREIAEAARQWGWAPLSTTRSPARSVGRDLRLAASRGDARVVAGPGRGQFRSPGATSPARTVAWLPSEPLVRLVQARGGFAACGLQRPHRDAIKRLRLVECLGRAYRRARTRGHLTVYAADLMSIRVLGLHPCQVWGALWWAAIADGEEALSPPAALLQAG
jgi:hypothetical protein